MKNNIIAISCIVLIVLVVCKISSQLIEYISRKVNTEREHRNKLQLLLNLSKGEAALVKYLFFRSTHTAWLPPKFLEVILLLRKKQIKEIADERGAQEPYKMNFYKNKNDRLYIL